MSQTKEEQLGNASISRLLFHLAVPAVAAVTTGTMFWLYFRKVIGVNNKTV